jgi:hypothetical protein
MNDKKFKYQELLAKFPNCPPADYIEIENGAFRWIHGKDHENNFKPINLISDPPPRMLDETDNMCKGFGLSLFDSIENAYKKYKELYCKKREHQREDFINEKGRYIATLKLLCSDGVAGSFSKSGHFTFHEYESTNLKNRMESSFFSIFGADGKFVS